MQDLTHFVQNHPLLIATAAIVLFLSIIVEIIRIKQKLGGLTPAQMTQIMNRQQSLLIDLREPEQYRKSHIINAKNIQPANIAQQLKKLAKAKTTILLVCASGTESQKLAASLKKQGYNAFSLSGGMRAWLDAQMPIVKD